jgi:lipopolysaccharide assembly protein A
VKFLKWILLGGTALVLLVFALSNREPVSLALFPLEATVELPLYLFFFLTLMLGVALGGLFGLLEKFRELVTLKRKDSAIQLLKNEIEALKAEKEMKSTYDKETKPGHTAVTHVR